MHWGQRTHAARPSLLTLLIAKGIGDVVIPIDRPPTAKAMRVRSSGRGGIGYPRRRGVARPTALEASQQSFAKVIKLSLFNYIA